MLVLLLSGVIVVGSVIMLIAIPKRRPRNHIDVSNESWGRVAMQEALEGFLVDSGLERFLSQRVSTMDHDDIGRQLNELRDALNALAKSQVSEAELYLIVVRTIAMILGVVGVVVGAIALIANIAG